MSYPEIVFIVAVAENGVIGAGGGFPWRLRSDIRRFKALTLGKPVVMGRKTFLSLPRPLPGRTNIVVTRDAGFRAAGAVVTTSLPHARDIATGDALRRLATEIMVIGGAEIYAQWIDIADRLEITEVHARPAATPVLPHSRRKTGRRSRASAIPPVPTTAPHSPMSAYRGAGRINPIRRCSH